MICLFLTSAWEKKQTKVSTKSASVINYNHYKSQTNKVDKYHRGVYLSLNQKFASPKIKIHNSLFCLLPNMIICNIKYKIIYLLD